MADSLSDCILRRSTALGACRHLSDKTQKAVEYIGGLYDIEASIRGKPAAERLRFRQEKARPLLQIYEAWFRAKLQALSSKSESARAINYSLILSGIEVVNMIRKRKMKDATIMRTVAAQFYSLIE